MSRDVLIAKIEAPPPPAKKQTEAFIDFVSQTSKPKAKHRTRRRFKFDWAGGLADMKDQFTAVELQHRLNDWR